MQKHGPNENPGFYSLPGIELNCYLCQRIAVIARQFATSTGRKLTVTDAIRSAKKQAEIIQAKLIRGETLSSYRRRDLADELSAAYHAAGKAPSEKLEVLAGVIKAQMARGEFISRHLLGKAIDVRCRDLSESQKQSLREIAEHAGASVIEESAPPHLHLQFDE